MEKVCACCRYVVFLFPPLVVSVVTEKHSDVAERVKRLRLLVALLPAVNLKTLKAILQLMNAVSKSPLTGCG